MPIGKQIKQIFYNLEREEFVFFSSLLTELSETRRRDKNLKKGDKKVDNGQKKGGRDRQKVDNKQKSSRCR